MTEAVAQAAGRTMPGTQTGGAPELRWAIVGTGSMATRVADEIAATGSGRVVGVVSRSRERGAAFAREHGVGSAWTSIEELLSAEAIDIAYVGSPNASHFVDAMRFIEAGRHVLCDKPLAVAPEEAGLLVEAAARAGVRLTTMFQAHHHPVARRIRDVIAAGAVGEVEFVRVSLGMGADPLAGWRAVPALAGAGSVFNLGLHAYDVTRFLLRGEVVAVQALVDVTPNSGLDRTALANLRLASGVRAEVLVTQAFETEDVRIDVQGSLGSIAWTGWMAPYRTGTLTMSLEGRMTREPSACPDAYGRLVRAFANAVTSGTEPDPSPRDAAEAVRIAAAVLRSGSEGREVELAPAGHAVRATSEG